LSNVLVLAYGRFEGHADDGHLITWHVAIHESDGDDLLISAPDTQGIGQHIGAEPPLPTEIAWVQLDRYAVSLPGSHGRDD